MLEDQGRIASILRARAGLALLASLVISISVSAQQEFPSPRLFTVMPAGGRVGTSVEVTIGGADLEGANTLYFSHPGLKAAPVPDPAKKGAFQPNKFVVTIASNTPVGIHDVRSIGKWGISNPRAFAVGDLNEVLEKEPNNDVPTPQRVELNTTINGTIDPNVDVDYFAFAGRKGQRVVVACQASSMDSRLDAHLQLYDVRGRLLADNRRYRNRDAVLDYVLPVDGDYFSRLCEHTYLTGGAEHFYRLTVSVAPWIDAVYPPAVEPGKPARITFFGRNLPGGRSDPHAVLDGRVLDRLTLNFTSPKDPLDLQRLSFTESVLAPSAALDGLEYRLKNGAGLSNAALLRYAAGPIALDNQDNDAPAKAQLIAVPCEVCGVIEKQRDRDWYIFAAKQNDVVVIESFADRIGSPVDLAFELRRADNGQSIGEYDDNPEMPAAPKFYARTDDPKTKFSIPADGKYQLLVTSHTSDIRCGPRFVYSVSVRKEKPDFRLVVIDSNDNSPDACTIRQGGSQYFQVLCFRSDGFVGEVQITAEGLPPGVTCPTQTIGAKVQQTALVVSAAADAPSWAGEIKIVGSSLIDGTPVTREARGGCIIWPVPPNQNIPAHSRLARSICLAVRDKGPLTLSTSLPELALPAGAAVPLKLTVNRLTPEAKVPVLVTAVDLPPGFSFNNNQPLTIPANKNEAEGRLQARSIADLGTYNFVVRGIAQVRFNKDPMAKQRTNHALLEAAPPIKLSVINSVATVLVSDPDLSIQAGSQAEITVRVTRLHGYAGEFKLQLIVPQGFAGVSGQEVMIPAGADEGKLILKSPANAAAGITQLTVRATAVVQKVSLTHDTPITVTVTAK